MKRSCSGVKMREIGRLPATMRLIWPRSTGIENEADFTIDVSLASASILKSGNFRHSAATLFGSMGRNLTVLSCCWPTTRRARAMTPASSSSSLGVSKK